MSADRHEDLRTASSEFWQEHYQGRDRPSSGAPNPVLAAAVAPLAPARALELGCGRGNDAIWLATQGWRVTAVDVSAAALERASARAAERGLCAQMDFQQHDLAFTFPDGTFDLISAVYLQSPVDFHRDRVLQRAKRAVAEGGVLLVVTHGSTRPWAWNQGPNARFPTPQESLAALEVEPAGWHVEICGAPERQATGPGGEIAAVVDIVIAVRRRTKAARDDSFRATREQGARPVDRTGRGSVRR